MIFDSHCHLNDENLYPRIDEVIEAAKKTGVKKFLVVGYDKASSLLAVDIANRYEECYAAVGFHPTEIEGVTEEDYQEVVSLLSNKKVVAIGEIGLDYHWPEPGKEVQQKWFRRQLELAREIGLPVVIHSRDAANDTMAILEEEEAGEIGGVMHCYSYTKELAERVLRMGLYIGVGGVLTFKNARKLVETVEATPLDRIVIETDSPYLAPEPNRGKRNNSANLRYVVAKLAEIKGITPEEAAEATYENAMRMYRI